MEYSPGDNLAAGRRTRRFLPLLIVVLLAFLAGLAAMAWLLSRWSEGAAMLGIVPPAPVVTTPPAQPAPQAVAPVMAPVPSGQAIVDPQTSLRVAQLEQRVAQLDVQSRAAVGNADRAEGLLVAFAARRALDRGVALGYIEGLLQQRFAATQPQAVATIITASRDPITLQKLQEELRQVQPFLVSGGPDQSWWAAFQTELGSLVSIRKEGTQSTLASERLRRAISSLEGGQVEVALAEVTRLPGRDRAAGWVAKARRYIGARRALDEIETAALLETRPAPQVIRQQRQQPSPQRQPARPTEPA